MREDQRKTYIRDLKLLYKHKNLAIKGVKDALNFSKDKKSTVNNIKVGKFVYGDAAMLTIYEVFIRPGKSLFDTLYSETHDVTTQIIAGFYDHGDDLTQSRLESYIEKLDYKVSMETRELMFYRIRERINEFNPASYIKFLEENPDKEPINRNFLQDMIASEVNYIGRREKNKKDNEK